LTHLGHGMSSPLCHSNEKQLHLTSLASNVELDIQTSGLLTSSLARVLMKAPISSAS
jgi:hypothetical protein